MGSQDQTDRRSTLTPEEGPTRCLRGQSPAGPCSPEIAPASLTQHNCTHSMWGGSSDAPKPKPLRQGRTPTCAPPQQPTAPAHPATVRGWERPLPYRKGSMCTNDKNQIGKLIKRPGSVIGSSLELHNLIISTFVFCFLICSHFLPVQGACRNTVYFGCWNTWICPQFKV